MTKGKNNYMFTFGKLHKAWRKEKTPASLKFYTIEEDTKLCVVATLEEYLKRTKVQLLLSFVLREAGIDTEIFEGHSTRSASTSKPGLAGLSVTDILERGSWSNASTWQRFCNTG